MGLSLRPAVATDLPRLMGLDHSVSSEYVWQVEVRRESGQVAVTLRQVRLPRSIVVAYPRKPFALADEWTRRAAMLVVAENDPLGYVCIADLNAGNTAWVTDLVVDPEKRRQGLGTLLLEGALTWARQHGFEMFVMEVQAKNYPAVRLAQERPGILRV